MFRRSVLRLSRRAYSEAAATENTAKKSRFDKSALKPMVSLLLFASVLTSVSEQQKRFNEMERRYEMKIGILQDLIERSKRGDFNYDAEKELELVNKLFARHAKSNTGDVEVEAALIREQASKMKINRETVIESMNSKLAEESLEDLFKDIMKDMDESSKPLVAPSKLLDERSMKTGSSDIVIDKEWLEYENEKEAKRLKFKPSTDQHVIVANPGEYNTSAEDTKVKRFL